jgi:hypothetical protein
MLGGSRGLEGRTVDRGICADKSISGSTANSQNGESLENRAITNQEGLANSNTR